MIYDISLFNWRNSTPRLRSCQSEGTEFNAALALRCPSKENKIKIFSECELKSKAIASRHDGSVCL